MKCPKCQIDPTPVLVHEMKIVPCGLVEECYLIPAGINIEGCPMSEWQRGYIDCLKNQQARPEIGGGE